MRKSALALAVVLLVSALALSGCQAAVNSAVKSGVENATGVKTDGNGNVTINKDGKEVTIGGTQEGKLPDGFPSAIPMYSPITIKSGVKASANGATMFTVTGTTTATFDDFKTFYDEKLKAAGWTVQAQGTVTNGAGAGSVNGTKGADKFNLAMVQTAPDKPVEFVLSVETKP
jgi:hypothetical protein